MSPEAILHIIQRSMWVSLECAGPLLAIGVTVGLLMGLVQAATQISEPSLTFVPKLLALGGSLLWFGAWMLERLTAISREMLSTIGTF